MYIHIYLWSLPNSHARLGDRSFNETLPEYAVQRSNPVRGFSPSSFLSFKTVVFSKCEWQKFVKLKNSFTYFHHYSYIRERKKMNYLHNMQSLIIEVWLQCLPSQRLLLIFSANLALFFDVENP